jgi:hypothetical protein
MLFTFYFKLPVLSDQQKANVEVSGFFQTSVDLFSQVSRGSSPLSG